MQTIVQCVPEFIIL